MSLLLSPALKQKILSNKSQELVLESHRNLFLVLSGFLKDTKYLVLFSGSEDEGNSALYQQKEEVGFSSK